MLTIGWIIVFLIALYALLKGAGLFLTSAEIIGKGLGFSSFAIGTVLVGFGTSLPELFSSTVATLRGETEFVVANAAGASIANILFILGVSAILAKVLVAKKNLIELDLPLLMASVVLFLLCAWDGMITLVEALFLLAAYVTYFFFILKEPKEFPLSVPAGKIQYGRWPRVRDVSVLVLGVALLLAGASVLVEAVTNLSLLFGVSPAILAATIVVFGTTLPELTVSVRAARSGNSEIALGNIIGSNIFNLLVVVGFSGLFAVLIIPPAIAVVVLPALAIATLLFIVSSITSKLYLWEGIFYVIIYVLFIAKMIGVA